MLFKRKAVVLVLAMESRYFFHINSLLVGFMWHTSLREAKNMLAQVQPG